MERYKYVRIYPDFKTDGSVMFCKVRNKSIVSDKIFVVKQHLESAKHIEIAERSGKKSTQQFIGEQTMSANATICKAEGSGRKKKITERDDQEIIKSVKRNRAICTSNIKEDLNLAVCKQTIRNRLKECGFNSCYTLKKNFVS